MALCELSPSRARINKAFLALQGWLEPALTDALSLGCDMPRLKEAMTYAVAGGKRLRALFVEAIGVWMGADKDRICQLSVAVELAHAYSLVHDDLPCMDDADTRRGKPSCHRRFDQATAVLAGDALLTLAFECLVDPRIHPLTVVRLSLVGSFARALGAKGMVAGQMMDLFIEQQGDQFKDTVQKMHDRKTAAMFAWSCEAAAQVADAKPEICAVMYDFGMAFGRAYQMIDDLEDRSQDLAGGLANAAAGMEISVMERLARDAVSKAWSILEIHHVPEASLLRDLLRSLISQEA